MEVAIGQGTTGTILGTVSDSTGAVVPGATITIRNTETGISRKVTTDAAGHYSAPQLGLGNYEVTAEAAGFQTIVRQGITLTVGREAVVDFAMQVGAVAESITVTGEAPLVNSTSATVGSVVDAGTVRDLPLNGRSIADLASLQPGVIAGLPSGQPTQAVFTGGGGVVKRVIAGHKPQLSTYLLDGVEISTPSTGTPLASVLGQQLGVDAIREFTLLQNNYGAQYGRAAGGVINAVTQSGTNLFHGSVFEFFRNDALDARDYFLSLALSKTPNRRNQFGASLGGPIQKDRTFFFLNYEGLRQKGGVSRIGATLTPETRRGLITSCPPPLSSCSQQQNVITATLPVNPDIIPVMNLLPLPNGNYRTGGVADYFSVPGWQADENYGIVRMDQQISQRNSLFGRLTIDRSSRTDHFEYLTATPFKRPQVGGYMIAAISETHVFSSAVLNSFRIGFSRRNDRMFNT